VPVTENATLGATALLAADAERRVSIKTVVMAMTTALAAVAVAEKKEPVG
jgi:hypothetical protein